MTKDLAIVIVNWNVKDLLRDCLTSVRDNTAMSADRYEVIVVDNASSDGSVDMLRGPEFDWIRLIEAPGNVGFAPGCQIGYEATDAPVVLLLNPDTVVHEGAINQMLDTLTGTPEIGILGSRLLNSDGSFQRAAGGAFPTLYNLAWNYLLPKRLLPRSWRPDPVYVEDDVPGLRDFDWVSGASLMFRRGVVGNQIFAPEFFMFGEDMQLCHRVGQSHRVVFSALQTITHHHGRSFAKQPSMEVIGTVFKGPRQFFRKDRGPLACLAYDVILFAGYLMRWVAFSVLAILRPKEEYRTMARFCRRYLRAMLRTLFSGSRRTKNASRP